MPEYTVRHENPELLPYVMSLPEGSTDDDAKAAAAGLGDGKWSLDPNTDPVALASGVDVDAAAEPSDPEEK